jgi:predicted nucleic acid-binding protein
MNQVFLDTVGLIALWDVSDQWHEAAQAAYDELVKRRSRWLTTTFIMLECGNAAARRPYRKDVNTLRRLLEQRGELIVPNDADWQEAWNQYDRHDGAGAGIVDQVSFVIMRRLGVRSAFTNDSHFAAAGFTVLF